MHRLWHVIGPLLDAARATRVLEIGTGSGATTRLLLSRTTRSGGFVHSIDIEPSIDAGLLARDAGSRLVLHHGTSLDVLPTLAGFDAVLIDGDHNWRTVLSELRAVADLAERQKAFPLILLHDVGWPYGRRDMYYAPARIPDRERHPAVRSGLVHGQDRLDPDGVNAHLCHALREGGERNGVLTAAEDFLRGRDDMTFRLIHGFHGLGVLVHRSLLAERPALGELLETFCNARVADHLERMESDRLAEGSAHTVAEARCTRLEESLAKASKDRDEAREYALHEAAVRTRMESTRSWRWTGFLRRIFRRRAAISGLPAPVVTACKPPAPPAPAPRQGARSGRTPARAR